MNQSSYEAEYKELLKTIIRKGEGRDMRDGNKGKMLFGMSLEFDTSQGYFPMLTGKKMFFKNTIIEALWLLSGRNDLEFLHRYDVKIWDTWDIGDGTIGKSYGTMFRNFFGVDQIDYLLKSIAKLPNSRQHVISLWNPVYISEGHKPPCYPLIQLVYARQRLNMMVHQRSADMFVGMPYDVALFSFILILLARYVNIQPGIVKINIGDAHIYQEHFESVRTYLNQETYKPPVLIVENVNFPEFDINSIELLNYRSSKFVNAKIIK